MPRFRFSLRALLLVLFVSSLVGSNLFTAWQLHRLRDENVQMRKELGRLVVSDRAKVNIIAVPTYQDMLWRWRIYVPNGTSRNLAAATHDIPPQGFPGCDGQFGPIGEGEYLVTAAIRPDRLGNWQITAEFQAADDASKSSSGFGIAEAHAAWLTKGGGSSTEQAGSGATDVFNPSEPIALLRIRTMEQTAPGVSSTTSAPAEGVMLWFKTS